jgi:hypothetical protein
MEGLKLRSFVVAGIMVCVAALVYFTPKPVPVAGRTEEWMGKVAPMSVAEYKFIPSMEPSAQNSLCSYKSPKMVYDTLVPTVGILARVYESRGEKFDVNLIASQDKASFHDPRVCFTAQGYEIVNEQGIEIPTKERGKIPGTLAEMKGPDGRPAVAVYFYRGPQSKFYGSTTSLKFALLWEQVQGRSDFDAVFYRFIGMDGLPADRLIPFITLYMDEAFKSSAGYF